MDVFPEEPVSQTTEPVKEETPKILYNPRTRLRELKRKLVAGPEKRYYELSETGVGKLQTAIALNLVLVIFCGLITTLYTLGMLPETGCGS